MSEKERIIFGNKIISNILKAQRELYQRKAKLGETVVIADAEGRPITVPAEEALKLLEESQS